ncbi:hypothetical protein INR75_03155 [Zunongwangia sp. SCSIO 43204]|mgnify:CR=1 FL=1|uniref:DUF6730 family protein n=1 Tax=Zunongwangia sp. SCSIO 43204 TaxID=2779359 RepID=UPI001CA87788|nr:DUF6730 family protein [Zunongwangia sp. SCSIO 43204]UAB85043.1 hypothetical protein INR75_03155 [Zunongwangia sp. SCSIO 43204]|tara:strand:+ start:65 stop:364 length:300 start_codon:yes stop_codon:yes gene_type:complete
MAKLEQLSELLVSEISQFEKTVQRLERIQQEKIGLDSEALEKLLLEHQEKMKKDLSQYAIEMEELGGKLEEAKAYPIWALIVFGLSILLNAILIFMVLF